MKKLFFFACLVMFFLNAQSQLTEGNWLVGGNASFSSTKYKYATDATTTTDVEISPNIGYFFIDRVAAGLKAGYKHVKHVSSRYGVGGAGSSFNIGPFVRYYFLGTEKPFNLLLESD